MSSIGPQLPPHLSKRKRTPDDDGADDRDARRESPSGKLPRRGDAAPPANADEIGLDDDDESDDGMGPSAPPPPPPAQQPSRPVVGPALPPSTTANQDEIDLSDSDSDTGPAPPPTVSSRPGPQAPSQPQPTPASSSAPKPQAAAPSDSDSDSDDDYGPALPSATTKRANAIGPAMPPVEAAPQRDTWMLAPPTSSGYTERDPTRMRSRKFASKPSASSASGAGAGGDSVSSIWTETPEEKLRRLQDSVLGRSGDGSTAAGGQGGAAGQRSKEQEERDRRIAASIEAQRGGSLYDEHSKKRRNEGVAKGEEEDDPSKRAFDKEKDMALGGKIGTAQRRELVTKAANFGGRFQKGSYL